MPIRTSTFPSPNSFRICFWSARDAEARDHLDPHRKVAVALPERVPVLLGQDRRRAENERLLPVQRGCERRAHRDLRLSEADVAADEPIHGPRRLEILLDRLDRLQLVVGLPVRERRLEPLEPVLVQVERDSGRLLAPRVEGEQLTGELAHRLARTALEVLPGLAAELRERRSAGIRADVAADLGKLLVRDVQAVFAAKREVEVVAGDARDLFRLEAEQATDPVILVRDVVAGAQVCERLERSTETRVRSRRALAKHLHVREKRDPEIAPHEATARGADDELHNGIGGKRPRPLLHDVGVDLPQQPLRAKRFSSMRKRDQHAATLPKHPRELRLRLG